MSGITILGQYKPLTFREHTDTKNYFFFGPDDESADLEEEISIQDNVVIWTSGQIVKRKITLEHSVIQVLWTNFSEDPNKNTKTDLCILHQEGLYVLVDQGSSCWDVHVSLPCKMSALWATHRGVLLQRASPDWPRYFSLLHPRAEIRPLAFLSADSHEQEEHALSLVACSDVLPHAIFYDAQQQQHSVWLVRRRSEWQQELSYALALSALHDESATELRAELCLECIYREPDRSLRADHVLLFADRELGLHYAVYRASIHELRTWHVEHVTRLSPGALTRQHVHAVQPLAVPHHVILVGDRRVHVASHVMLVCSDSSDRPRDTPRDWTLVVHAVAHQICAWPLAEYLHIPHASTPRRTATPLALTPTRTPRKGDSLTRVTSTSAPELEHVTIEDSVANRFNIAVQFAHMDPLIFRAVISLTPSCARTRDCLAALRAVVPAALHEHTVRVLLLEAELTGDEWHVFSAFMKQLFRTHFSLPARTPVPKNSSEDAWSALLASTYHRDHVERNFVKTIHVSQHVSTAVKSDGHVTLDPQHVMAFKPHLAKMFHVLHLLYEEYKLDQLKIAQLAPLSALLSELSVVAQCRAYTDHYLRDSPQLHEHVTALRGEHAAEMTPEIATPPSIYLWLITALRQPDNIPLYPLLTGVNAAPLEVTRALCRVYHVILTARDHPHYYPAPPTRVHVTDMFDGPMPPFMNAPARATPTESVHEWSHVLVEEANLLEISLPFGVAQLLHEALARLRHVPPRHSPARLLTAIDRLDLLALYYPALLPPKKVLSSPYDPSQSPNDLPSESRDQVDGTELSNEVSFMRFAKDTRLKEVRRLLRSAHVFGVHYGPEDGEDLAQGQQLRLLLHCHQHLARTVARGMFTLGTDSHVQPLFSEGIPIPALSTTAKFRPQGTTVTLDLTPHPDLLHWPEFHNGVAAGLRLPPELAAHITSTWIIYQKRTAELTNQHAGFLLALGLQGHLRALSLTKVYEYLSVSHELTGVALLLGMAASKLGTQDSAISRLLSVHVTALHPPLSQELDVPFRLQTAALLALGMLYRGTCHRRITEVLLTEIGRKPVEEKQQTRPFERESHSLTAGLALGLVVLARADSATGLHDLDIQHRLLRYITGGPSDQRSDTRVSLLSHRSSDRAQSSTVLEGTSINVDITAPGAVLALALLYLKSRDRTVAARIDIPDTQFAFQYLRPDLVLLRVLAKNLILWDDIQPEAAWIEAQVPSVMTGVKAQLGRASDSDAGQTLRQGYVNVLTGACLAMGIRFAGTAHSSAKHVLTQYLQFFIKLQKSKFERADKNMLEYCMNSVALALCMVMSGTGHLGTFKILRSLRKRVSIDVTYGNHMALNMAIGFLFLGGGRYTLDTSNQSVAFLLCAIYPRFPQNCRDNRYHLQALRHLYALAAVPRCIEVRDVDTQRPVYVPLKIHFRPDFDSNEHVMQLTAPCLVPPLQWITRIELATARYWPLTLSRDHDAVTHPLTLVCSDTCQTPVLHVKRKSAYLDYDLDPDAVKSLAARPYSQPLRLDNLSAVSTVLDAKNRRELLLAFSADPHVLAFATHFASGNDTRQVAFCTAVLLECLSAEKLSMIDTYLTLDRLMQSLTRDTPISTAELWNVKLICQLYTRTDWPWLTSDTSPLLQLDYLTSVKLKLDNYFDHVTRQAALTREDWLEIAKKGNVSPAKRRHVTELQNYYELPCPRTLEHVLATPQPLLTLLQHETLRGCAATLLFLARLSPGAV